MSEETPIFKFALREDLKEDKQFLPTRGTPDSAGWDCRCAQENRQPLTIMPGEYVKIPLGFRIISPKGYWLKLNPRSSTFAKKSLHCLYGVIDSDYRNFVYFVAKYDPDPNLMSIKNGNPLTLEFGEAIGQLIPVKLQEMIIEEVSNEDFDISCSNEINNKRQLGGFGSTSK